MKYKNKHKKKYLIYRESYTWFQRSTGIRHDNLSRVQDCSTRSTLNWYGILTRSRERNERKYRGDATRGAAKGRLPADCRFAQKTTR